MGDKISGSKNNLQGANIGNFVNEARDNAQVTASQFMQTRNVNTAELLSLIAQLRQTAAQFPPELQEEVTIDIDDIEAEIKKPETQRNLARLKKRLIALAMIGSAVAAPIAGVTDFANKAVDLGHKLGIELRLPPAGH
jgi:internalin A